MGWGNPTITGLATQLVLEPDAVLAAITGLAPNEAIVRRLYEDYGDPDAARSVREMRRNLLEVAHRPTFSDDYSGYHPFVQWSIRLDRPLLGVFPLSPGFRGVLREATARREREALIRRLTPDFAALDRELGELHRLTIRYVTRRDVLLNIVRDAAADLGLLQALDSLLAAMLENPHSDDSEHQRENDSDRRDVVALRQRLTTLRKLGLDYLVLRPRGWEDWVDEARDLLRQIRRKVRDSSFVSHCSTLADNAAIAPPELWLGALERVREAYSVLLHSEEAEDVVERDILPLIQGMAAQELEADPLDNSIMAEVRSAIMNAPEAPARDSAIVALVVGASAAIPNAVGNTPGPNSLAMTAVDLAAPVLVQRYFLNLGDRSSQARLVAWLYRVIAVRLDLTAGQRSIIRGALFSNDPDRLRLLRRLDWSRGVTAGWGWGAVIGLCGVVSVMYTIASWPNPPRAGDERATREYHVQLVNSIASLLGGLTTVAGGAHLAAEAQALQRFATLMRLGMTAETAGPVLGIIGGLAAIVTGVIAFESEVRTGDTRGAVLVGFGVAAALMSTAGFLMGAGAATSLTVAGAPLGVVLMFAGAVLGITVAAIQVGRQLLTAGSQQVFEAYIVAFGETGSYLLNTDRHPDLERAYLEVRGAFLGPGGHHAVDFWRIDDAVIPQLWDVGFRQADLIALAVGDTDSWGAPESARVRRVLSRERPESAPAPAQ